MKSAGRLLLILSLSIMTGCSTVKGWFSDDDYDPREPVELQKIDEQVKVKKPGPAASVMVKVMGYIKSIRCWSMAIFIVPRPRARWRVSMQRPDVSGGSVTLS